MHLSKSVFSDNYFFIVGVCALLTPELIDEYYYIVDIDYSNYNEINFNPDENKRVIAFISNDFDYYYLKDMGDISFIDKGSKPSEILSLIIVNDSRYKYRVKHHLSSRECEILSCMQEGMAVPDILEKLGVKMKTFYAHRRNIMLKLKIDNRISLYSKMFSNERSRKEDDAFMYESIL
ncbi:MULTISPECIES: helix-turn-helix transcriptional regulator [unclassified Serratia (in: enterobacteria)]|uniref:helix-turn-helix transcriptional regulator n=1 Tax=unclassified Serratia (in: enterobacteria) TaxID=2647522 RepID=UPI003075F55B